jgi:hypothetical protein
MAYRITEAGEGARLVVVRNNFFNISQHKGEYYIVRGKEHVVTYCLPKSCNDRFNSTDSRDKGVCTTDV